ncbi:MAG: CPBP family intramembrane metalloprotease [Candidatus Bathyarchaeota archaeon]|jgi:membrane protease YdiL (CAAX protease family)|nr:CPBP family intramembrane metalloprotease [Candidatus Bathyarchaeota archaeon A05DMB-3]MDH7607218.1 CPBP family intramembrane metalloprotease [Candidatus Bathyarchaeota archaeon]
MIKKTVAFTLLAYFTVALLILLSGWAPIGGSGIPIFLSISSLTPLYLWQRSYQKKMKLSKEINGRPKGVVIFWVFSLFFLALLVRIPSVLLFNMPYEKAPLIYLLILTIILVERIDVSAFGFKTRKTVKALLYGLAFYVILGGTALLLLYLLIHVFTNQTPILSFNISSFLLSMPFQTLLVGISEEGLFRGYIQTHLQKFYTYKAVFIQAALFGFWHFVWNISPLDPSGIAQYVATTFFIGLLFGYFYIKAKNLVPLILAHGLWNSVSTGMIENTAALDLLKQTPFLNQVLIWFLPYAIAITVAFFFIKCLIKEI